MEALYRRIGFCILFGISTTILVLCLVLGRDVLKGPHLLKVAFPNVGTLILQEPVAMDGVEVGRVSNIQYTPEAAMVTLEFYKRIQIPAGSEIINFNHSMMGARMIYIQRKESIDYMDMSRIQQGVFREGVGEMLVKAQDLLNLLVQYRNDLLDFRHGTDSTESILAYYNEKLLPFFDKYSQVTENLKNSMVDVQERAQKAVSITREMAVFFDKSGKRLDDIISQTVKWLSEINALLERVNSLIDSLAGHYQKLQAESSVINKLLLQREIYEKMKRINTVLGQITEIMKAEGLSKMFNFWRNIHIMGKNPTRKSLEQQQSP